MDHEFIPTMGFEEDCAECCKPIEAHRINERRTAEHDRKVELMLKGAWDSPIYAAWKQPKGDDGPIS
jgi:hypothetical protein